MRPPPLYGCILIGGKSVRMGQPKHLLIRQGRTWLEWTVECLEEVVEKVVIAGAGRLPEPLKDRIQLSDAPQAKGPLAGLLAALRWAHNADWLITACDQPLIRPRALRWLLDQSRPDLLAVMPHLPDRNRPDPLPAWYNHRAGPLLEQLAASGNYRLTPLAENPLIETPPPPPALIPAWKNINTREDL